MIARRTWLRCALGLAAGPAAGASVARSASGLAWRERALLGFGTTLWLRAGHADAALADRALDDAVTLLRHIERQMSLFDPNSALQRLNTDGVLLQPDPHLVAVLQQAQAVATRSSGAFDVTVQPLWAAWQRAQAAGRRPSDDDLARARALVGWRGLQVSERAIRLARPGMAVTLNGIAQGYAAEQARALLRRHSITAALLDCGEWAPVGTAPDGQPWRLGLASPRDSARLLRTLAADGRGIAVSTDTTLRFGAGDRDHHILDPHTGRSPPHLSAVVVAATSTTLADALTKVLFMGTADQALARAAQWGVDAVVVDKAGRLQATPGWH